MKWLIASFNIFTLLSIICLLAGILMLIFAFDGIAIAVPFFSKVLLVLGFISLLFSAAFFFLKTKLKVKIQDK